MICPKCKNIGRKANAGFSSIIPYYYCDTCKEEIELDEVVTRRITPKQDDDMDLLAEFERLIADWDDKPKNIMLPNSDPEDKNKPWFRGGCK